MKIRALLTIALIALVASLAPTTAALAQIIERKVDIYSAGTRLRGTEFYAEAAAGQSLPAIIMSHGWGGTAAMLHSNAERFARAGYVVLAFDYRGWGDSEGRWVNDPSSANGKRELREVVDPLDQAVDLVNAVHWMMGEPLVDRNRVGLWGTSFSGGLVAYVAARDPRIKAIVSQVAFFGPARAAYPPEQLARARADATRRARGELGYPPPGVGEIAGLRGAPVRESFLLYSPIDDIAAIKGCAMLVIDAEKEELFNLRDNGELAFTRAAEPKKRVVIPAIGHYAIYGEARDQALELALDWMDRHLKGASAPPASR